MNDIEILKTVAAALRQSADEVAGLPNPFITGPFGYTALVVTGAVERIEQAARELDTERDRLTRQALAGLGIVVPDFLRHDHEPSEATGIYHENQASHNGYPQHWHYRDADGTHVGTEQGSKDAYREQQQEQKRKLTHLMPEDPSEPFAACCGINCRSLAEGGDLLARDTELVTCEGRQFMNLIMSARAEQRSYEAEAAQRVHKVHYSAPLLPTAKSADWQRLAMVLVAQLDDLTHAAVAVSDADLLGVDGLNICWRRDPATDKNVYWLEDPAQQQ